VYVGRKANTKGESLKAVRVQQAKKGKQPDRVHEVRRKESLGQEGGDDRPEKDKPGAREEGGEGGVALEREGTGGI